MKRNTAMLKLIPRVKEIKIDKNRFAQINHIGLGKSLLSETAEKDFTDFGGYDCFEEKLAKK